MNTHTSPTTDLVVVRKHQHRFTWGLVRKIHDIGPYTLVEYRPHDHDDDICFHVYVDGVSTSNSCNTLEEALLLAIARKNLEANEARYMATGACRILGLLKAES